MGIAKLKERKGLLDAFRAHAEGAAEGGGGAAAAAPTLRARLAEMEREKERISETLSCAVCMEVFELPPCARTPKALPCMHSFCERCLLAHARGAASIECPTCRETTQLPREGVAGLKNNCALLGTLESFLNTR
jgi:tripartite motif-containing protein 2/3